MLDALTAPYLFVRDLLRYLRWQILLWGGVLTAVHGIAPLFFLDRPTARLMLGGFVVAVLVMSAMHLRSGITRLMGLAHLAWLPGMAAIVTELARGSAHGAYRSWLGLAALVGTICLAIDTSDVVRYLRGDRAAFAPPPGDVA